MSDIWEGAQYIISKLKAVIPNKDSVEDIKTKINSTEYGLGAIKAAVPSSSQVNAIYNATTGSNSNASLGSMLMSGFANDSTITEGKIKTITIDFKPNLSETQSFYLEGDNTVILYMLITNSLGGGPWPEQTLNIYDYTSSNSAAISLPFSRFYYSTMDDDNRGNISLIYELYAYNMQYIYTHNVPNFPSDNDIKPFTYGIYELNGRPRINVVKTTNISNYINGGDNNSNVYKIMGSPIPGAIKYNGNYIAPNRVLYNIGFLNPTLMNKNGSKVRFDCTNNTWLTTTTSLMIHLVVLEK